MGVKITTLYLLISHPRYLLSVRDQIALRQEVIDLVFRGCIVVTPYNYKLPLRIMWVI